MENKFITISKYILLLLLFFSIIWLHSSLATSQILDDNIIWYASMSNERGYLVSDWNYIFFDNPSDNWRLYRINNNWAKVQLTNERVEKIVINWDYIYYTNMSLSWRLYRIDKNWQNRIELTTDGASDFIVDNSYVYYRGTNAYIYRIDKHNWWNKIQLNNTNSQNLFTDWNNYIYYRNQDDNAYLYRMDKDWWNKIKLSLVIERRVSDWNYIYYINSGRQFCRMNLDFQWANCLANSIYWYDLQVYWDYIYYYNFGDYNIYRIDKNWSNKKKLTNNNVRRSRSVWIIENNIYHYNEVLGWKLYRTSLEDSSNGSYQHYILNRLTATEGNMKNLNNTAPAVAFSNYNAVKNNFLANYQYRKSWYEAKWLTSEVLSKNVKWNEWVIFSKSDLAWGMLNDYKLSANYDFMSDDEMDNVDSSIFWRWNLSNTSFQTDANWNTVWLPAYIIRNQNGNIVWYLEYPCWNLICKDKGCTDIKNIVNAWVVTNKPPTPTFSSFSVNKNAKYVWLLTATDPEKDALTYSKTINANHWTVVILNNGTFGYLPVTNYVGNDTFTYSVSDWKNPWVTKQVNITVNDIVPINNPPVPTFSSFYTNKNTNYNGNLTATDTDWDTLTYNLVTTSKKWTLNINSNWSFSYNPNSFYVGTDSFIYSVTDWKSPAVTKTVNIMVNDYIPWNVAPTPITFSIATNKNTRINWVLTATDPDWGTLYFNLYSSPSNWSINISSNGNYSYTPNNNYVWIDWFTYSVSDWFNTPVTKSVLVNVANVTSTNNPPVPTLNSFYTNKNTVHNWNLTASDIENDTLTYSKVLDPSYWNIVVNSNWSFTYTPSNGYIWTDSFIYSVSDWYNSAVQKLVTIQVNDVIPGNAPPVVDNIPPITVDKNTPINTIIDSIDPEWDAIIYTPITTPENGTITIDDNWNINYIPDEWFSGTETIIIWIWDWINPPVEKEITIIINDPVVWNYPPVAVFSSFSTWKNKAYQDTLTAVDPENDNLTFSLLAQPLNWNVIIDSNWDFVYTPNTGYVGTDIFTYLVLDWHNNPVSWTVNIVVNPSIDTIWNEPTPPTSDKDIFCTATDNWKTTSKTILVLNPKADTKFIQGLKWKSEYIKTISASGSISDFDKIVENIIKEKVKSSKLNQKSNLYDFGSWWTITGIQYNLTKIPNSAVMRKLVDLAIDHSTQTMAEYTETMKSNCSSSSSISTETIPAGFLEVNDKGETILNLFRYNK